MRTAYSYVTLRYVHDVVTEEFVNVGVVLYAPDQAFVGARFIRSYERLNRMFGDVDETHFKATVEHLSTAFHDLSGRLEKMQTRDIHSLVQRVLPADDSSLQWSNSGGGLTDDPSKALNHLFSRLVELYAPETKAPVESVR